MCSAVSAVEQYLVEIRICANERKNCAYLREWAVIVFPSSEFCIAPEEFGDDLSPEERRFYQEMSG